MNLEINDDIIKAVGGKEEIAKLREKNMLYSSELTVDTEFDVTSNRYFGFDSNH